jgi:DNA-binding IclR family transcriptional regulator
MAEGRKKAEGLQTVSRAVAVLRCFEEGRAALPLAELTRRTGLNKVTVFRLAETLAAEGMLSKDADTGVYSISYGLVALGRALLDPAGLSTHARPVLEAAQRETGETAILSLRQGNEAVVLSEIPSPEPVRYTLGTGFRADLRIGAAGLAILAQLPETEAEAVFASPGVKTAEGADIAPDEVQGHIRLARERGYATTVGQRLKDAAGYAAPLIGQNGQVIGSIGVIMPAHRNQEAARQQAFATAAKTAAQRLNAILSGNTAQNGQAAE